ncbi:M28 family peptidase [Halopelagius longus]|uniref:Carboxypeptidase Q n=1 Tax=Halopelagius longus TaxID=1236180 RepID=A0A1H0XS47_9EURY|nr:M28 family metallopeptidase [Halopelagius longus]RDI72048.1 aminopeptidase [Halopelagius longus]SDQ05649.1 Zn-dependent amino-or carboxypeptidase, M28 family [Halopelagius longus]
MDRRDSPADADAAAAAALGRAWTDDAAWEFLTRLTSIGNRMGGSDGERRAAELVAEAFRGSGVEDVRERPFEMRAWHRGRSTLRLTAPDERTFDAVALPYSPSGDVTGELADVGHGTPDEIDEADVDGKIAVASTTTPSGGRFVHRMEKFGYAVDSGAEAFVFVNHVPGQLPPTGSLTFGEEAVAPAVGVSKESGAWLTDYADRGVTARLTVEAETTPGESRNVVGRVGPDTDEELLLVAHYDAHDIAEGALDNGCGIATVVVAARILAAMDLPLGVRVAAVGCEETGLLGSERLADEFDDDRLKAVVNVDGAGRFRDLVAMTHTSDATERVARRVSDRTRHPIRIKPEPHPFSDQWPFVRAGVPALQLHSDSGERGRGWGHTHADTRDKVDDRNIREHAMLTALLVRELAGETEVPRLDADTLAAAFRAEDFEAGMRAANLWPDEWA